jgi:starch-binding outer membrane protein, SusD/RagB family
MNTKLKILATGFVAALTLLMTGCAKKLTEHPFTAFTPSFFQTAQGLQSAVNTLYAGMRFNYGPEPALAITVMGTDEFTGGDQVLAATGGQYVRSFALYGGSTPIQSSDGSLLNQWNNNFNLINLANAVIGYAPGVTGLDTVTKTTLVAEAHFLRGLYYLLLVEQFGAVPTDLGSGDLVFNQKPFQGFNRLPVTDVLTKDWNAIIADFTFATQNLPVQRPANAFKLSQGAAYLMLSRVYLYRGYSTQKQASDFQNALAAANQVINNQSEYGVALQPDFGQVHKQGNDYNSEVMYSVERLPDDINDNETPVTTNTSGAGNNASVDFAPNYTDVTGARSPGVGREAVWGRPYRRFCPTSWLLNTAFADKFNDSRFDNSFQMMWPAVTGGANGGAILYGDTAFVLAKDQAQYDTLNGRGYAVVLPSQFWTAQNNNTQDIYPYCKKFADSLKANYNDVVDGRPYQVAKFSEMYLLAAEAAMQGGDNTTAANMINVLRTRAAYRPGLSAGDLANRVANMQITSSQVTLDLILDERSREFCGESMRWPDLAMRGQLVSRVQAHNPDAGPNIQGFDVLRPIPQSELNAIIVSGATSAYQNPGY